MRARIPAFLDDRRGQTAMIFSVMILPVFAIIGAAIDFGRARDVEAFLRNTADAEALAVAQSDDPTFGLNAQAATKTTVQARFPDMQNVTVTAAWADTANYKVTIQGDMPGGIMQAVPYMPKTVTVSTASTANRIPAITTTTPPKLSQLDPEAGDYNRIYMYCYDNRRKSDPDKGRRAASMMAISDNGGTNYNVSSLPSCNAGESISYRLHNVRNMRTTPSKWDDVNQEVYDYFTDTSVDPVTRVQTFAMAGQRTYANGTTTTLDMVANPILETILCDTAAQCKPQNQGGILPNNHVMNRTPAVATGGCLEGKLMYYGWEDRPPNAGSDRDYDDIRLVVTCPQMIKVQDKQVKLVK
jgi:Flp pilus assembly protein TadG